MLYLPFAVAYTSMVGTAARQNPEAYGTLSWAGAARPDSDSLPILNELIKFPEPTYNARIPDESLMVAEQFHLASSCWHVIAKRRVSIIDYILN
jgi:hypothetical protein